MGKVEGRITYSPNGQMMAMLMHERRNQARGNDAEAASLSSYSAYFGTYQASPEEGIIRHQVVGSLNANASGVLERTFVFKGDDLVLGFTLPMNGEPVTRQLVWRRIPG